MSKREKEGRISQPGGSTNNALVVFAGTTGEYTESSGVILSASDKSVIEAATLENCTVGYKEARFGSLTSATVINYSYQSESVGDFSLQLDRSISLVCDITAHKSGATASCFIELTRDGGVTAHTLTISNANGVVNWVGLATVPDFSDLPAGGSADIYLTTDGGDAATINATRAI